MPHSIKNMKQSKSISNSIRVEVILKEEGNTRFGNMKPILSCIAQFSVHNENIKSLENMK